MQHRRHTGIFATILAFTCLSTSALAASFDRPIRTRSDQVHTLHSARADAAKARVDTLYVLGGPDRLDGSFEDAGGGPAWNGWTTVDNTVIGGEFWHVSDFMAPAGQFAMWCGTDFDGDPGYGNSWTQDLVFTHQLTVPIATTPIRWEALLAYDTEAAYDYVFLQVNRGGEWETLRSYDGRGTIAVDESFSVTGDDMVGDDHDELQLRVRFESDGAWSDEDGLIDTDGACQIDEITVTVDDLIVDHEDFEDQVSDRWLQIPELGVGNYGALYIGLQDLDECRSNSSVQVAFIDDGVVVPGTGGTPCITWCYGPGGYIINNSGGLLGPDPYLHLSNSLYSPVVTWPATHGGGLVAFDVYEHSIIGGASSGVFWNYDWRSSDDPDPDAPWGGIHVDTFLQIGGPHYRRVEQVVTGIIVPNTVRFQFIVNVRELGYIWGWDGDDGTPAPYFDNFVFKAWEQTEPEITARVVDLANDGFPEFGDIDPENLAANSVRFDVARNISPPDHLRNDPGDSVVVHVALARSGAELTGHPLVHVRMLANPLFDGVRTLPSGFTQTGDVITGTVEADSARSDYGVAPEYWSFDLPDTGFFYPGDEIRYFVEATNIYQGDLATAILPADTSGFADPGHTLRYDGHFTVRALPTLFSDTPGDQPAILLWNDFGDRGAKNHWYYALGNLGLQAGRDYDVYTTQAPSSGVGNGLGGRATSAQLADYDMLLYSCGDLSENLLANGDYNDDPSNDLAVVTSWFAHGDKHAFMTGDNIVSGLLDAGPQGSAFVSTYFNVGLVDEDIRAYIANQTSPLVLPIPGNGIIRSELEWISYGGCYDINRFDAIEVNAGAQRLAEITDPAGNPGVYTYSPLVHNVHAVENASVVVMPMDFATILNVPGWTPPPGYEAIPARAILLEDILDLPPGPWSPIGVAPDAPLRVEQYPNPFNPQTTIALDLPRAGAVSLKIFDVRGNLVRTLVDERLASGRHEIVWSGDDERGAAVSSGVYFAEIRADRELRIRKLALVK